jgi:hemoglobin/transferrin/lactoferrin receptor protein
MVERVEVVRGTGSVLHGSRAVGGVVNFITKKGGYHSIQGTLSSSYDSATNGNQLYSSLYGHYQDFDYRVAGTTAEHNDRDTPAGEIENTSFENDSFSAYLGREFGEHAVALSYDDFKSSSEVYVEPEVATTPPFLDFRIDAPRRDRRKAGLFYDWTPDDEVIERLHVDGYYQSSKREFNTFSDLELDLGMGPVIRNSNVFNDSTLDTLGLNSQVDLKLNRADHLIIGVDVKDDELDQQRRRELVEGGADRPTENVSDRAQQTSVEVFAQNQWDFLEDWALITGVRGYHIESELEATTRAGLQPRSVDDQHAVGSIGVRYVGLPDTTLWTTWSEGYVSPNLVNLGTGAFAGPDFVSPNLDLDPETSNSVELGLRLNKDLFNLDTSVFYTEAEDYIDHVLCSSVDTACIEPSVGRRDRVYVNIDQVRSFGAEATASLTMLEQFTPYASASWIRRRFETPDYSSYATGIPQFSGRLGAIAEHSFRPTIQGWLDLYLRLATDAKERVELDQTTERAGWGTINLSLGTAFGAKRQLKLLLELENLGDKLYIPSTENLPARGRSAIVKIVGEF